MLNHARREHWSECWGHVTANFWTILYCSVVRKATEDMFGRCLWNGHKICITNDLTGVTDANSTSHKVSRLFTPNSQSIAKSPCFFLEKNVFWPSLFPCPLTPYRLSPCHLLWGEDFPSSFLVSILIPLKFTQARAARGTLKNMSFQSCSSPMCLKHPNNIPKLLNEPTALTSELVTSLHPTRVVPATFPLAHYASVMMTFFKSVSHLRPVTHTVPSAGMFLRPLCTWLFLTFKFQLQRTFPDMLIWCFPPFFQLSYTNLLFSSTTYTPVQFFICCLNYGMPNVWLTDPTLSPIRSGNTHVLFVSGDNTVPHPQHKWDTNVRGCE